ncbi:MAG: hypothetical protein AAFW46_03520, partial [Pseudomonadota bacterium]
MLSSTYLALAIVSLQEVAETHEADPAEPARRAGRASWESVEVRRDALARAIAAPKLLGAVRCGDVEWDRPSGARPIPVTRRRQA